LAEKGFDQPIASFDEKEDAYDFAVRLTRGKQDATVLLEERDGFSVLPVQRTAGRTSGSGPHSVQ